MQFYFFIVYIICIAEKLAVHFKFQIGNYEMVKFRQDHSILILEDDPQSRFIYEEILGIRYALTFAGAIEELRSCLKNPPKKFSYGLFDLKLPDGYLLDMLGTQQVRASINFPFTIVSSFSDVDILRYCFELGADDYLTKPFSSGELLVKVQRRLSALAEKFQLKDHFNVDIEGLTPKENQILGVIFKHPGQFDKLSLFEKIWKGEKVSHNTFDVHLSNLRKKIRNVGLEIRQGNGSGLILEQVNAP